MNETFDPRESDPMHDDIITQEEFEAAAAMSFPTITIPDPKAVQAMLLQAFPDAYLASASYDHRGWSMFAFLHGRKEDPTGHGATPGECLADLRAKLAACDPVAKLARDAAAAGYALTPISKHIHTP